MKNIMIMSDTHGNSKIFERLIEQLSLVDYVIHLGDFNRDCIALSKHTKAVIYSVKGNCDDPFNVDEQVVDIDGIKILICHGHQYSVKYSLKMLSERAADLGVKYAMYGHTHEANICELNGVTLINPGTLADTSKEKTYAFSTIIPNKLLVKIVKI